MAEGYNRFEIVSLKPLIRIYKIDIKENIAISYVEQFILYRVKSKGGERKIDIPEEWIIPNENGIWRAASSDYYTIIFEKDNLNWKISDLIRGNYANKPLFVHPKINGFRNHQIKNYPFLKKL